MRQTPSLYIRWKKNNPQLHEELILEILRLKNRKYSQVSKSPSLDDWDDHLFMTLSKTYMEKRVRQQIIRGLLNDAENTHIELPKRKSNYEQWKECNQDLFTELIEGIQRLKRHKIPHLKSEQITNDWWDKHLFLVLTKNYSLEKRIREIIINGLLNETEE